MATWHLWRWDATDTRQRVALPVHPLRGSGISFAPEGGMNADFFSKAYQAGLQRTIRFLVSHGISQDAAQDMAQAAWTRGWICKNQLRDETTIVSWVNAIALNILRRTLRSPFRSEELTASHYAAGATRINENAIDVTHILNRCEPQVRALLLAELEGSTPKELAAREGVTPLAIRIRMMRARRTARKACEPRVPLERAAA